MPSNAEGIISKLILDINNECQIRGQNVSDSLIAFIVKAVIIDPANSFSVDQSLTEYDLIRLKEMCVMRILDSESPTLDTIKMQLFFELNYADRNEFIDEHKKIIETRLHTIIVEMSGRINRSKQELDLLYRKVISILLIKSGLGSPTNIAVIKETAAALQKILPRSEIGTFASLNIESQKIKLNELTDIVSGIRVYNFTIGHGGDGIDNLPVFLNNGLQEAIESLNMELKNKELLAAIYTAVFLKLTAIDNSPDALTNANIIEVDAKAFQIDRDLLKAAIINVRQNIAYLKILRTDLLNSIRILSENKKELTNCLTTASTLMNFKVMDPSPTTLPFFKLIGETWSKFQNEVIFFSGITNILNSLQSFSASRQIRLQEVTQMNFVSESEIVTDAERMNTKQKFIPSPGTEHRWKFPKLKDNLSIELHGYCAWSIVRYRGLLVPSCPSIGVFEWKNKLYGFSSVFAAEEFELAVEKFVFEISEIARQHPELIQLLDLQDMFASGVAYFKDKVAVALSVRKCAAEVQTEVHPIEHHIETAYTWNEWELRRRALQLANIRGMLTKGIQTHLSNWRRDNCTQVWLPKTQGIQTKREYYSQVPTPSVFLYGLRGCGGAFEGEGAAEAIECAPNSNWCTIYRLTDSTKVDLTIPVTQQLLGSNNGPDRPMH